MNTQRIVCIIPARYASTRLPAKPLAEICGKPLIVWAVDRARSCNAFAEVIVATDDERIVRVVTQHGGVAVMTASTHESGTDRVNEAASLIDCSHIVNLQGDEPNVPPDLLRQFARELENNDDFTLLTAISNATMEEKENRNVVKVVIDRSSRALYFSRAPIPVDRDGTDQPSLKHYGIYGYTRAGLARFCGFAQGDLEKREKLEQLRALENGMSIRCLFTDYSWRGVDTPEDLMRVRTESGFVG